MKKGDLLLVGDTYFRILEPELLKKEIKELFEEFKKKPVVR